MTAQPTPVAVDIRVEEDIIIARQKGRDMARQLGFGAVDQSRIATAISELTRNIIRYAEQGRTIIRPIERAGRRGLEVVCEDSGPGIADVKLALQEGVSSGRGLGIGLPGTQRLMDEMDIVSEVGKGTTVTIRKWTR